MAAALREVLTSFPLYRRRRLRFVRPVDSVLSPASISAPCPHPACREEPATTWSREADVEDAYPGRLLRYKCVHCDTERKTFWVLIEPEDKVIYQAPTLGPRQFQGCTIQKLGQAPPWGIAAPKEIQRSLGESDLQLYGNALVCMSQSYGLGALAYFRRVVENTLGELLGLVEEAATAEGDQKALSVVKEAQKSKVADEKLRLIREVIPASLRPGGVNPFAKLYDDYSRGIHSLSDEECLTIATELRDTLEYVFGNIRDRLEQAKAYRLKITGGTGRQGKASQG